MSMPLPAAWTENARPPPPPDEKLVADARTWLLARGWLERGGGAIRSDELPRSG